MGRRAVVLTGSLGMGHHVITEVVAGSLGRLGFQVDTLDCMGLLGPLSAPAGDWVFRRLLGVPSVYDGLHFAHFRPGSRLAAAVDAMATRRLVPALARALADRPPDLVLSTFATGASAAAKLGAGAAGPACGGPDPAPGDGGTAGGAGPAWSGPASGGLADRRAPRPTTVVLCTDVTPHSLWVRPGVDLFLVTSQAAAAAVRRYQPRARIAVVPPPVRPAFGNAPDRRPARRSLGVDADARCALVMGGGWGLGPLAAATEALAAEGVTVLAVAGSNRRLHRSLLELAARRPGVVPYGYADHVPTLMAAADVVVTTPGATTCSEARAMGRPMVLLDVVPGHGRDNVQHELELGDAEVCDPDPARLTASVLAALDRARAGGGPPATGTRGPAAWEAAFADALAAIGMGPAEPPAAVPGGTGGHRAMGVAAGGPTYDPVAAEEAD